MEQVPGRSREVVPASVVVRVPQRQGMSPFTTGMLVAGLVVGGPASVVSGVLAGQLGAVAFPVAVVVVVWLWWRREGWAGMRREVSEQPLLPRGERRALGQAVAGAVTMLAALYAVLGGGR